MGNQVNNFLGESRQDHQVRVLVVQVGELYEHGDYRKMGKNQ
jgi:hypothetical protein